MGFLEVTSRILLSFVVFSIGMNMLYHPSKHVQDWNNGFVYHQIYFTVNEDVIGAFGGLLILLVISTLAFSVRKINILLLLLSTAAFLLFYNPFINKDSVKYSVNLSLIAALLLQPKKKNIKRNR